MRLAVNDYIKINHQVGYCSIRNYSEIFRVKQKLQEKGAYVKTSRIKIKKDEAMPVQFLKNV